MGKNSFDFLYLAKLYSLLDFHTDHKIRTGVSTVKKCYQCDAPTWFYCSQDECGRALCPIHARLMQVSKTEWARYCLPHYNCLVGKHLFLVLMTR